MISYTQSPVTKDELFDHITHYIAHPHTVITEHDKRRAILIFNAFDEFLLYHYEGIDEDIRDDIDFGTYAAQQLDILEGK